MDRPEKMSQLENITTCMQVCMKVVIWACVLGVQTLTYKVL